MVKYKEKAGVTLIALVITILILLILVSVSVFEGGNLVKEAKVQTIETNMLSLQAKAKGFAEDVEAQIWAIGAEEKQEAKIEKFYEYGMIKVDEEVISGEAMQQLFNNGNAMNFDIDVYYMTEEKLKNDLGLNDLAKSTEDIQVVDVGAVKCANKYIIVIDENNYKNMDIIYTEGISYKNILYYTLSALQEALEK